MNRKLDFYTDGAYSSKSEMGGWAALCIEEDEVINTRTGYEPYSTGNRCELLALLSALEDANTVETSRTKITIYTDSAYVANCFADGWYRNWLSNGWKTADKQPVKNQDLWVRIIALYIKMKEKRDLEIVWIKGHAKNKWNEYADLLAKKQRILLEQKMKEADEK